MRRVTIFLLILCIIIELANCKFTDVVFTTYGPVQGEIVKTRLKGTPFASYRGIPFAKPPIGELRYKAPMKPDKWTKVKNATKEQPMCSQLDSNNNYVGDENCLYINVYTPVINLTYVRAKIPVLTYIYGGAFSTGSNNQDFFGPDHLIEQGIIVALPNYRLGPLGFLCLNDSQIECNLGLKDQHFGLKWVKENIALFGGDPTKITLGGQSAGAVSVQLQMLSRVSEGLFIRTLVESGSPLCPWAYHSPAEAYSLTYQLVNEIAGCPVNQSRAVAILKSTSAKDLVEKTNITAHGIFPYFRPTVEENPHITNRFLTNCPIRIMLSGNYTRVPQMTGFTRNEVVSFLNVITTPLYFLNKTYGEKIAEVAAVLPKTASLVKQATSVASTELLKQVIDLGTDLLFKSGIDLGQRIFSKTGKDNIFYYQYEFDIPDSIHRVMYQINETGTGHGDDLGEIFWVDALHQTPESRNKSAPINQVARNFTCLVSNFVKTGNPTTPGSACSQVKWPDSRETGLMMNISTELSVVPRQIDETVKRGEIVTFEIAKYSNGCSSKFN